MNIKEIKVCPIVEGHYYTFEIGEDFNGHEITSMVWEEPYKLVLMHNDTRLGCVMWIGNAIIKTMLYV